jgi:hypothetical protein
MRVPYPLRGAALLAVAGLLAAVPAAASAARPSFTVRPAAALDVAFRWEVSDHALRCAGRSVSIRIRGARGWRAKVGGRPFRSGSFSVPMSGRPGRRKVAIFRRGRTLKRFHLRCLPSDYPSYGFRRVRPGGPAFVLVEMDRRYPTIFNRDGVPVWWLKARGVPTNFELMADGTVSFVPVRDRSVQEGIFEIRTLGGRLLRRVGRHGRGKADVHELLRLRNGNYLLGRKVLRRGVDTRRFGGSENSSVIDIEIQEVTPRGRVVWRWNSADRIALAETGRWWRKPILDSEPYDIVHWNSVDVRGRYAILSFRHLDAVYKIDRRTGRIVWKLGGTRTPERLNVVGDPLGRFPLGAQHDARFLTDGTISIYDNRSELRQPPRVVRYRINEPAGRARLVQAIGERRTPNSLCCGSARRVGRSWVVGWGRNRLIGGYDLRGRRLWSLTISNFSYRAHYATSRKLRPGRVRAAMDAIARRGAAGGLG